MSRDAQGPGRLPDARPDAGERWRRLAEAARAEPSPVVDVTHRVMAAIAAGAGAPSEPAAPRALVVCALSSLAAAGIVALVAAGSWADLGDPLLGLLQSVDLVMR